MILGQKKLMVKELNDITKSDGTNKKLYFVKLVDREQFDIEDFMIDESLYNDLKAYLGKDVNFNIKKNGKFININLVS